MGELIEGVVVSHLGKGLAVASNGKTVLCHTRRQLGTAAVGDRVLWQTTSADQGQVVEILPRKSVLIRPLRNGKTRPVAANIDTVFIIFAVQPSCDFLLIDQYLTVCENRNIQPILVCNKIDLLDKTLHKEMLSQLQVYQNLGYRVIFISAKQNTDIDRLKKLMVNKTSLLAGQSGVGKSSVTNAILPDKQLKTNSLSHSSGHGRHTTTTATLYPLPEGGALIDSPGVAIFGLAEINEQQLAQGFREFQPLIDNCQFHNCRHVKDKGCAVRSAVEEKRISMQRYQRFLKLKDKMALVD